MPDVRIHVVVKNMYNNEPDAVDEPAQLRGLSKSRLHEEIAKTYFIPELDSRCCTRQYLIQVFRGDVFRVRRQDILGFEVTLTPDMSLKSTFFNIGLLRERASVYLTQLGHRPFGFPINCNPDEQWFVRTLRYIDPFNVLGAFRCRIPGAPVPACLAGRM